MHLFLHQEIEGIVPNKNHWEKPQKLKRIKYHFANCIFLSLIETRQTPHII